MTNIPLFKLDYDVLEEEAVLEVLRSKWISTGPKTSQFETMFGEMLGSSYSLALSNCTAALHIALQVMGVGEGDEVIVPSLTFVATANSVKFVRATPVFCDVKGLDDLTMSPEHVKSLITNKTKAIIVMHYAGYSCDMDPIMALAKEHNLFVIEDACHGPLSEYKGKKLGTIGDIGCFSFFSNKNLSTAEGGMLVTNNKEYFDRAKAMRSHGMTVLSYEKSKGHTTGYDVSEIGYNYRMDDIRAALGCVQLQRLEHDLHLRQQVRQYYLKHLSSVDGIVVPFTNREDFSSNYIFPVVLTNSTKDKRENVRKALREMGVETSAHYPAVHKFSLYAGSGENLPNTEYIADNEITLPMYGTLTEDEVKFVCDSLNTVLGGYHD